jgi:sulfur-oxidizing protein SoxB
VLEDVADNLFNPDPYLQQGGDMVRVGGLAYSIDPIAVMGKRIGDMTLGGKPIDPKKHYKVAGWASVQEGATGEPIWDVVAKYLRDQKVVKPPRLNLPAIRGMKDNPGLA